MADMQLRETVKTIEINEETYHVRKMPPWTATYLVKLVAAKVLPILSMTESTNGSDVTENLANVLTDSLPNVLDSISEDELKNIMIKCLNYADKVLPAGPQQIMRNQAFGVRGVESDFMLCMNLVIEVIKFNCADFFEGLGSILSRVKDNSTSQPKQ